MVVEGTINGVLDPFVEFFLGSVWNVEVGEEFGAECQVGDFVVGSDVVDVVDFSFVENRVECVGGVACEEVASGWGSVSVENDWLTAVKEEGEFWNDF